MARTQVRLATVFVIIGLAAILQVVCLAGIASAGLVDLDRLVGFPGLLSVLIAADGTILMIEARRRLHRHGLRVRRQVLGFGTR